MDLISIGGGIVSSIINLISGKVNNSADLAKLKAELEKQVNAILLTQVQGEIDLLKGQLEINKVEAAHTSLFVSGWRPFLAWSLTLGFITLVALMPALSAILAVFEVKLVAPNIDMSSIVAMLTGLLGLGGLRSYDKKKQLDQKAIYDTLRAKNGGRLSQAQVDLIEDTIEIIEK